MEDMNMILGEVFPKHFSCAVEKKYVTLLSVNEKNSLSNILIITVKEMGMSTTLQEKNIRVATYLYI